MHDVLFVAWLSTEAVARIQDIVDGKNIRRDFRASVATVSQPSCVGSSMLASTTCAISTSVSFTFYFKQYIRMLDVWFRLSPIIYGC